MPTVAFHTLGCKVNQYDSQAMLEKFLARGYIQVSFDLSADVYVVNTCTVTGTGDKKSMQAVRRAIKTNPGADVIVAGCLAQRDGEKLLSSGARLVIGARDRDRIVELYEEAVRQGERVCHVDRNILRIPFESLSISGFSERTRAVMKIQEGCDRYCSYCIIPYVRGGIRSRPLEDIRAEAARLGEAGFGELVLTGIHLTSYGRDLGDMDLADAVRAARAPGISRIRLGSLEPVVVTPAFTRALREVPEICPQFHLALQSGSDAVLKRMKRRYTCGEFRSAAALLRDFMPGCALTTDVICGFPGETDDEFSETMAFCREIGFSRMHVFPFSPREGTPAASMPGQVPRRIREERTRKLIALGHEMAAEYHNGMVGSVREILCEDVSPEGVSGYTREYVSCFCPPLEGISEGQTARVRITGSDPDGVTGQWEDSSLSPGALKR
ncbi:MAG: tRNA (N(6)-L-threonylcarbamoyladenosine(37)-C(2))-methylthiotransferase MtaB [Clostridia bacterium]|nr:tRNA (N(6)-L-threonylcarbamoyladenosine(37)-C(2))-methylthiotransferase MtaB [Clostridia bacterium]